MKKKLNLINLLLPLIVLFTVLFPAVHSYEHIYIEKFQVSADKDKGSDKAHFKTQNHTEECAVCSFKFSPVSVFTFESFEFYTRINAAPLISFCAVSYADYFKGYMLALRGPPSAMEYNCC